MTRAPHIQTRLDVACAASPSGVDGSYDVALAELGRSRRDEDSVRAIIGHLARAGVLEPRPAPPDRAAGRITGGFDGRAAATCAASVREAERVRWSQYRAVWGYVESDRCRRAALLAHFGDRSATASEVDCCDVCVPAMIVASKPARGGGSAPGTSDLDGAILEVVGSARPPVGRTRAVEILRGGRSKVVARYAYDALDVYGVLAHLRADEVLGRVDELLAAGRLRSTGGRFPKLCAA